MHLICRAPIFNSTYLFALCWARRQRAWVFCPTSGHATGELVCPVLFLLLLTQLFQVEGLASPALMPGKPAILLTRPHCQFIIEVGFRRCPACKPEAAKELPTCPTPTEAADTACHPSISDIRQEATAVSLWAGQLLIGLHGSTPTICLLWLDPEPMRKDRNLLHLLRGARRC